MKHISNMNEELRLSIDNRLPELDRLRSEVECFLEQCGVEGRASYHIQLALDELVTNVIHYAFDAQGGHAIELALTRGPSGVDMVLTDSGKPFNPLMVPEPDTDAPLENRRIGGLGVHFVRKTMDSVRYERADGRNILYLSKKTNQEP